MRVPLTIGDFLERAALIHGDRVALVDEPAVPGSLGSITYRFISLSSRDTSIFASFFRRAHSHFNCRRRIARSLLTRSALWRTHRAHRLAAEA